MTSLRYPNTHYVITICCLLSEYITSDNYKLFEYYVIDRGIRDLSKVSLSNYYPKMLGNLSYISIQSGYYLHHFNRFTILFINDYYYIFYMRI